MINIAILTILLGVLVDDGIHRAPSTPLDPRIKSEKITERSLPAMPSSLVQPVPSLHRIALRAEEVPMSFASWTQARQALDKGLSYLRNHQGPHGGWMEGASAAGTDQDKRSLAASSAVTALAIKAFAQAGEPLDSKVITEARGWVVARVMSTGAFEPDAGGGVGNYVASAIASGWSSIGDESSIELRDAAVNWLKSNQWDQSEGLSPTQDWFGGSGYGKHGRPDLSNTQVLLDALHDAGVSADDPAVQRALLFVSRTQNLKSTNDAQWSKNGSNDGGFVYTPANGGESFASETAGEGRYGEIRPEGQPQSLRSYGSMTYAGFKSMLFAGLSKDDVRVRAAWDWIRGHWTFDENPGMGLQGHYYYLHAMSRALCAAQQTQVEDATGVKHNWREELTTAIATRQRPDGSWINTADRWEEGQPDMATIYALLALEEILKPSLAVE